MLTSAMPALATALRGVLNDHQMKGVMQALGNCNQPIVHRGPVANQPSLPPSTGGGTYNGDYWNWQEFGDIVNINGDTFNGNTFNEFGGNAYNSFFQPTTNYHSNYTDNSFNYNHGGDTFIDNSDRTSLYFPTYNTINNNAGDIINNYINNPPGQRGERGERGERGAAGAAGVIVYWLVS